MPDSTTSGLTAASTLDGTEVVPITQGGNSRKATVADFRAAARLADTGGVAPPISLIRASAARALTNATGAQKIFGTPTNGALTLPTGTYLFEAVIGVTGMSATSGNAAFGLLGAGTATLADILYAVSGRDNALNAAGGALGGTASTSAATNAAAVTAGTATAMWMQIRGSFEVTATGTIIPSINLLTASAASIEAGSFFLAQRVGAAGLGSVGDWS